MVSPITALRHMGRRALQRLTGGRDTHALDEQQTAELANLHRELARHPAKGLSPAKLYRILEDAEAGDLLSQHELFLDMEERDGHLFAEMSKRRRALVSLDWSIEPPRNASAAEEKAAVQAEEILRELDMEDVILDCSDAIGHAFSCLEIQWAERGPKVPEALIHRPQSWFTTPQHDRNQLRLRDHTADGAELWPWGWVVHTHRAKPGYIARGGLHRVLAWPYLFKNYAVGDLAELLEVYGLPTRIGKYHDDATPEQKATLLRAVAGIGHHAAGIIPESMLIEFKEAADGKPEMFQAMIDWCESTVSKVILGGTLTSSAQNTGLGSNLGDVHNEVRHDLLAGDALQIQRTLTRDLVWPVVLLNTRGITDLRRCPRLVFDTHEPEDLKVLADGLTPMIDRGVRVPVSWWHEKTRIPMAEDGEAVLGAPAAPTDKPDGEGGDAAPGADQASKFDAALINAYSMGIERIAKLGVEVPQDYIRQVFGLPKPGAGQPVLTPSAGPAVAPPEIPAALTERLAALKAALPDDALAPLADTLSAAAADPLRDWIESIRALADQADSPEALRDALLASYADLPSGQMVEVMELAFAIADAQGRLAVIEERGEESA